jgi:uncharacterized membrane protein YfcA
MFGVGGGFLMTPLLVFYGIPPGIAVATQASHITASSVSGALAHFRRQGVDIKMGAVLLTGGLLGSVIGVYLFALLRSLGQIEFVVTASYVVLLGTIGGLMLNESLRTIRQTRETATPAPARSRAQHLWIHGLPLKMRFRRSKLYISVIPPLILGFTVGALTAILGVGGGFLLVPAMIYWLRMPTNVVVGTSQFQILFVTAATTVLHATTNHTVDLVLALLLVLGAAVGVQFGVRTGSRLRGEELRALLAILVVAVAFRLLLELVARPDDLYSLVMGPI